MPQVGGGGYLETGAGILKYGGGKTETAGGRGGNQSKRIWDAWMERNQKGGTRASGKTKCSQRSFKKWGGGPRDEAGTGLEAWLLEKTGGQKIT